MTPEDIRRLRIELNQIAASADKDMASGSPDTCDRYALRYLKIAQRVANEHPEIEPLTVPVTWDLTSQVSSQDERRRTVFAAVRHEAQTLSEKLKPLEGVSMPTEPLKRLERIFLRFHSIGTQLRIRHGDRSTLAISDEYDVQDLLHAMPLLDFVDVRVEEWTPSRAGSSSRADFLLKSERIFVEVKKSGPSHRDSQISKELTLDHTDYSTHPDCKTLVCFVYDPEHLIGNAAGLKRDVEALPAPPAVRLYVHPTGE